MDMNVHWSPMGYLIYPGSPVVAWEPLTDDGDALRLAVKLDITLSTPGSYPAGTVRTPGSTIYYQDDCLRRAIVIAAAAIGKAML